MPNASAQALTSDTHTPPQYDWLAEAQHIASLYTPPHTGRPSVCLTDVYRLNQLLKLAAEGNYLETAAKAAGFSKQTLYNWKHQAEAGHIAAIALMDALEKAEALGESDAVADMRLAGKSPQFWAARATFLERKYPDRWGRRQDDQNVPKVIVQVGVRDGDVQVNVGTFAPTQTELTGERSLIPEQIPAESDNVSSVFQRNSLIIESIAQQPSITSTTPARRARGAARTKRLGSAAGSPGGPYRGEAVAGGQALPSQSKGALAARNRKKA